MSVIARRALAPRIRLGGRLPRQWSEILSAALLATLPVHVLAVRVGFAAKAWMLPLLALGFHCRRRLATAARSRALVAAGVPLLLGGGLLGLAQGTAPVVAARHLIALVLLVLALLVWMNAPVGARLPAGALRVAGFAMSGAAIAVSFALMSGWGRGAALRGAPPLLGPLGSLEYGAVLVSRGLHHDSNFSAWYAISWIFLVLAIPLRGRGTRRRDSVLVGLLIGQAFVAFSRSGMLALAVGSAVYLLLGRVRRRGVEAPEHRLSTGIVGGVVAVVLMGLVAADLADGVGNVRVAVERRLGLLGEGVELVAGMADELGDADRADPAALAASRPPDVRLELWRGYLHAFEAHPLTGVGFGAGVRVVGNYAHNTLLEAAAGGGVASLAGLLALWLGAGLALARRWRADPAVPAVTALLAATLVSALLLTTTYDPLTGIVLASGYGAAWRGGGHRRSTDPG